MVYWSIVWYFVLCGNLSAVVFCLCGILCVVWYFMLCGHLSAVVFRLFGTSSVM